MNRYAFLGALLLMLFCVAPADAGDFARFWSGCKNYWRGVFGSVSGVVGVALLTGIIAIFIITRGKWVK